MLGPQNQLWAKEGDFSATVNNQAFTRQVKYINQGPFAAIDSIEIHAYPNREIEIIVNQVSYKRRFEDSQKVFFPLTCTTAAEKARIRDELNLLKARYHGYGYQGEVAQERIRSSSLINAAWPHINPNNIGCTSTCTFVFKGPQGERLNRFLEAAAVFDSNFSGLKQVIKNDLMSLPPRPIIHQYRPKGISKREVKELEADATRFLTNKASRSI